VNKPIIYITGAKRTPVGTLMGGLSKISAPALGSIIIEDLIKHSNLDPALIDEVIMGQVLTGGAGQNPARIAAMKAGIPKEVPSFTVNKVCGSGLKSVILGAQSIGMGDADLIVAGGQENMSLALHGAYIRAGAKFGDIKMIDLMQYDGLLDAFSEKAMGITAENIAKIYNITRQAQDEWAASSQNKAAHAQKSGFFKNEITTVEITVKKETKLFEHDEGIREGTTPEILAKLKPAFLAEGSVTAGNSSSINDGAAAVMIASERAVKEHNLEPMARIVSYAACGVDPDVMGIGPIHASRKALKRAGWGVDDLDLIELNEAFASQVICVNNEMKWDIDKVNIHGSSIALGHPIGASGTRVLVTLLHSMIKQKAKKGLVTMCIGGGMGLTMCVETR
jgi:acetyl-CoA C-acetyltransferase